VTALAVTFGFTAFLTLVVLDLGLFKTGINRVSKLKLAIAISVVAIALAYLIH